MGWVADLLLESPVPPPVWLPGAVARRSRARVVVDSILRGRPRHGGWHASHHLQDLRGGFHVFGSSRVVPGAEIDDAVASSLAHLNPPTLQGWSALVCLAVAWMVLLVLRAAALAEAAAMPRALLELGVAILAAAVMIVVIAHRQREIEVCRHGIAVRRWTEVWRGRQGLVIGLPDGIHARVHPTTLEFDGPGTADLRVSTALWPPSVRRTLAGDLRALGLRVDGADAPLLDPQGHGITEPPATDRLSTIHVPELRTARLLLRGWRHGDLRPFAELNADPDVMEYFPNPLSKAESDRLVNRFADGWSRHGFGIWAVERLEDRALIGMAGLSQPSFDAPFMPAVEIGWRFARHAWGRGYATEAAEAAVGFGFERLGLEEIVSFTAVINDRSRRVMERIGMTHDPADDFDHPRLPHGDRLRRHVLYRLRRADWERAGQG